MASRKPNAIETKLHQAVLRAPNNELTAKQLGAIVADPKVRQDALNFLLAAGLFKSFMDKKNNLSFKTVSKVELTATKDLTGEENLVLGHIKASNNEGIWTKHLKAKTNLHQTVIDRCIKTLTQKRLIKRVQSVQHATRKIYMLEGIEPSISLTGGPWYTDNELDTEFIDTLMKACLKLIRDMSFPNRKSYSEGVLYPLSNSPKYPTAQQIASTLKKARLTETELTIEHVDMLLNVLVLDGEIERVPAFGTTLWNAEFLGSDSEDDADRKRKKRKRKHESSDSEEDDDSSRKRKKKRKGVSDDETDSDTDQVKKKKKKKLKVESDSEDETAKRRKKDMDASEREDDGSEDEAKRKKKKRSKRDDSSSDSDSDDSDRGRHGRKSRKRRKHSASPMLEDMGAFFYRAIKEERVSLGWSQAPCSKCPSFAFCKDGGPVNPSDCVYYGDWLAGGTVEAIEDAT
ncbi:RNA polymerase Rpc34 [Mucidula mucida]|nr:RNA polymerase Rpc34 [Mucidula mucida]